MYLYLVILFSYHCSRQTDLLSEARPSFALYFGLSCQSGLSPLELTNQLFKSRKEKLFSFGNLEKSFSKVVPDVWH